MGSVRSASTAYSSGGLFSRHRGNSVYVSPENGQLPGVPQQKMSMYDRLVGRRSGRNQKNKQGKLFLEETAYCRHYATLQNVCVSLKPELI